MQSPEPIDTESQTTGFPGVKSWGAVYALVSGVLLAYLIVLAVLTRMYQ